MAVGENLNRNLYKVEIALLKGLPLVIAIFYLLNTILSYFNIDCQLFSCIAGMSVLPMLFIYISSWVFKFCLYHRVFLYYIIVNDIITWYDFHIGIPVINRTLFAIHLIIAGLTIFIAAHSYVKSHKKPSSTNS